MTRAEQLKGKAASLIEGTLAKTKADMTQSNSDFLRGAIGMAWRLAIFTKEEADAYSSQIDGFRREYRKRAKG